MSLKATTIRPVWLVTFCFVPETLLILFSVGVESNITVVPAPVGNEIDAIDEVFSTIGPPDWPRVM